MTLQAPSPDIAAPTREEEQADVIRRLEEDIIFGTSRRARGWSRTP